MASDEVDGPAPGLKWETPAATPATTNGPAPGLTWESAPNVLPFSRRGGMSNPAMQSAPDAPAEPDVVTLGELRDNPKAAIQRIGAIVGKDVTDPKLWLTMAASYFGPKVFSMAAPIVGKAAAGAMRMAPEVVRSGATAAGAYVGGPAGAVVGRTVGEAVAGRMRPPVPEGPVSSPGYPRAGSTPAPQPAPVEPPAHLDLSQRVPAGGLTQQQIAERLAATKAQGMTAPQVEPVMAQRPSPSSVPVPEGPPEPSMAKPAAPSKSPQQILNEEAIAKRRAAYQESLKADAKPVLEDVEAGKMTADQAAAELAKRWGTPSDAERRFPPNKSGLPSNPPTARKAMGKVSDLADMPATEPPKSQTTDLEAVSERIRNESGGKIAVMDLRRKNSGDVELETIAVSPRGGGEGAATKAMESLVRWADEKGVRLVLSPSEKGYQPVEGGPKTTSTARLKDFYKRFGFVEPKGRNYDPTISSPTRPVMFRKPVETEPSNPPTARKARGNVSDLADMPVEPPKPVEPSAPSQPETGKISSLQSKTSSKPSESSTQSFDPNANLIEQEMQLGKLVQYSGETQSAWRQRTKEAAANLADLRNELSEWLRTGGTQPNWKEGPYASKYYGMGKKLKTDIYTNKSTR